ncbi:hypothetical protein PV325_013469, partial [Microctonus aethiopoides]
MCAHQPKVAAPPRRRCWQARKRQGRKQLRNKLRQKGNLEFGVQINKEAVIVAEVKLHNLEANF